jgi:hypothetical protein
MCADLANKVVSPFDASGFAVQEGQVLFQKMT